MANSDQKTVCVCACYWEEQYSFNESKYSDFFAIVPYMYSQAASQIHFTCLGLKAFEFNTPILFYSGKNWGIKWQLCS